MMTFIELISSWFCTNRPNIWSVLKIPPFLIGPQQSTNKSKAKVSLCEEWLRENPQLKDKVKSDLLMTKDHLSTLFLKAEIDYEKKNNKAPHPGVSKLTLHQTLWCLCTFGNKNKYLYLKDNFYTGKENKLYDELRKRIVQNAKIRFSPGDLYGIALELCSGNQFEALRTCHNMLRGTARGLENKKGDPKLYAPGRDVGLMQNHLVPLRENDDLGAYYHLFGAALFEHQSEQDQRRAQILLQGATVVPLLAGAGSAFVLYSLSKLIGIKKTVASSIAAAAVIQQLFFPKMSYSGILKYHAALWTILNNDWDGSRAAHLAILVEEKVFSKDDDPAEYCLGVFGISVGLFLYNRGLANKNELLTKRMFEKPPEYWETANFDTFTTHCPVSLLVVDSEDQWAFFDQQNGTAYGTANLAWMAFPAEEDGWTVILNLPRHTNHTIYVLPVNDGSFTMSRSSKNLRSSAFFKDIPIKKDEYLTISHVPDDLNQSIRTINSEEIKPTGIYKAAPLSQIKKEFAGLMPTFSPYNVDWSKAAQQKSKYSNKSIDWWMIEPDENNPGIIIGEDTDEDGVIDFIHADTTGDGKVDYSVILLNGKWSPTNLVEAWLEVNFSLPWPRSAYVPYSVDIYFNDVKVASYKDSMPEGHYAFPIPPRAIRFPGGPDNENKIDVKSEHLRGGHYSVTSDFQVLYRLTEVDTFVIAESRESAEKKVYDTPGFRFKGMDLGVNSNDITISKQGELTPGEKVEITANIHNLGMDPGKDITVALLQAPAGSPTSIEVARILLPEVPLYGPKQVKFTWTTVPGEQALRVVIDPDKTLEENSRFNNEALLIVKVSGKDNPPQLEITLPEEGQKFDSPKVKLEARGIDESGISLMEYRIDGGLWTQRKGDNKIAEDIIIQPGEHIIYFRTVDCSGNQTEAARKISVECKKPAVAIESPAEGEAIAQNKVTVKVALENPEAIITMEARTADGAWKTIDIPGQKTIAFDLAFEFGKQPLEVKVIDINGVEAIVSRMVEITTQKK